MNNALYCHYVSTCLVIHCKFYKLIKSYYGKYCQKGKIGGMHHLINGELVVNK